jgi:hypothetical protein
MRAPPTERRSSRRPLGEGRPRRLEQFDELVARMREAEGERDAAPISRAVGQRENGVGFDNRNRMRGDIARGKAQPGAAGARRGAERRRFGGR